MEQPNQSHSRLGVLAAGLLCIALSACSHSNSTSSSTSAVTLPDFDSAQFSNPTHIDNPYVPYEIGVARTFVVRAEDTYETLVVERLDEVRPVAGVDCAVVRDRVWEEGLLIEDTRDFYAQDDDGNLWYMGEEVDNFEYDEEGNLIGMDHEGAWEAGLDVMNLGQVAKPGYAMKANPVVGEVYYQEFYPGAAEDQGKVIALSVPVTLADGSVQNCLQTEDFTPLEPGVSEYKYYLAGVGVVLEEKVGGSESLEWLGDFEPGPSSIPDITRFRFSNPTQVDHPFLPFPSETTELFFVEADGEAETIVIDRLDETRVVMGIECIVVRDQVYQDDLLVEDTYDWFAQDDDGNLWYMGEEVLNYEYDDEGKVISTDSEGSWEAGLDINGSGSLALPGFQIPAQPSPGDLYYQEFYEGEAEDMAVVIATNVQVLLEDGSLHEGCLQTLEWTPLDPASVEFKFYAPGLGLVLETKPGPEERLERKATMQRGPKALPDVSAASFSDPATITHEHLQYVVGSSRQYSVDTEDGIETIILDTLSITREVMGIDCAVVQDRVFLDELLIEDTYDWFAQDDDGNVWYMGEEVDNYNYDEKGQLIDIDHISSWEAGLDILGLGQAADPGHHMPAAPMPGASYHQEFYPDEAEDMAAVIRDGLTVELRSGKRFPNCLQTLEWNPLEPGTLEYKFYAPGVGLVREYSLGQEEEAVELEVALR